MHRDRVEDALDGALTADLALRRRRVAHPLEELENVSVRTTVLVDGHVLTVAAGPFDTRLSIRRRTPFRALELDQLPIARSVLESGQPGPRGPLRGGAPATGGGENGGGSEEPA